MNKFEQAREALALWYQPSTEPELRKQAIKSLATIFVALKEKQEREKPEALTMEELFAMEKNPVWIKSKYLNGWIIVDLSYMTRFVYPPNGNLHFEDYGKTWLAYRSRPKEAIENN